jgi:putative transposase
MKTRKNSLRLVNWDYAQSGGYVITICTHNRQCVFGEITDNQMVLNPLSQLVHTIWFELTRYTSCILLDEFIVMPNHIHGIMMILDTPVGVAPYGHPMPVDGRAQEPSPTIGIPDIVNRFKSFSTAQYRQSVTHSSNVNGKLWQRGYYDHIIRNEADLDRCRHYILNNPAQWALDRYHSTNT